MKTKSLVALCVCGVLYGASVEEAKGFYDAKAYEEAYYAFGLLVVQTPQSPEYNFLLGHSALETKRYDEALAAFERVLMLDSSHARTRLEMARVYFETGRLELASAELERVLGATLPSNIREVVLAFKARVDGAMEKHRVSGAVVLGVGYDTNINNDIGKREFIIPAFGGLPLEGGAKKSDSFAFATAVLNHSYDMGLRGGWSMEQSGVFYSKLHRHTTENNLALFSLSTAPTFKEGRYTIAFPVGFDKVYIDGKGYMSAPSLGVKGSYLFDPTLQGEGSYILRRSSYSQNKLQDSTSHIFDGVLRKVLVPENPWIIALRAGYTKDDERHSPRTDVEAAKWRYGVELSRVLPYGVQGTLSYLQTQTRYSDTDATFLTKRKDTRDEFGVRLSYAVSKTLSVGLNASYVENSSNHAPFDYDKVTTTASVVWGF